MQSSPFKEASIFSQEAEEAVLGCILVNPNCFYDIAENVNADSFFFMRHTHIWTAIQQIIDRDNTLDILTVTDQLKRNKTLDETGGMAYLTYLINNTPSAVHGLVYAGLVRACQLRRDMLKTMDSLRPVLVDESITVEAVMDTVQNTILDISLPITQSSLVSISNTMSNTYDLIEARNKLYMANKTYTIGIRTPFPTMNRVMDGIRKGEVTTLAGRTGMGKTACALSIVLEAAERGIDNTEQRGARIAVFSGEMSEDALNIRLLSMETGIDTRKLERGELRNADKQRYITATAKLGSYAIMCQQASRIDTVAIENIVRSLVVKKQLDMLVLDGLNQLDHSKPKDRDQDWQVVMRIMNELERISRLYDIAILVTHQLNRESYNKEPSLASLGRGSAVEQKSARIIFLYEPPEDPFENEESSDETIVKRMCKIAKNRHGDTAKFPLAFIKNLTRYAEMETRKIDLNDLGD